MGSQIARVDFGLANSPGRFGPSAGGLLQNAYVESADANDNPFTYHCRPGFNSFGSLNGGAYRGSFNLDGVLYVVNGSIVDKVENDGTVTQVGTFAGVGPVSMARNRKTPNAQIAIVGDGLRSIISNDTVAPITDADLPTPEDVCGIGGYFVFAISNGAYYWTTIDEGTEIDALDFKSAEANADGLVACRTRLQELILYGEQTVEFHALTGSTRVFERVPQTTITLGALAKAACREVNGVHIFPATDRTVRLLDGYSPVKISTHDIDRDLEALDDPSSLTAFVFQMEGHSFYCLNSASWTWVCDLVTSNWFKWKTQSLDRWRIEGSERFATKTVLFDYEDMAFYTLARDGGFDAGDEIIWKLTSKGDDAFPLRAVVDRLFLDLNPGAGLLTGTASQQNPKVMLRTSTDDGRSWSNELVRPVGKLGQYDRQVSFRRLGITGEDGMRYEIAMSAGVNRELKRAAVEWTPLKP